MYLHAKLRVEKVCRLCTTEEVFFQDEQLTHAQITSVCHELSDIIQDCHNG